MSDPSFENSKTKIEKFCRVMINQSLIDWQEKEERVIESISIQLVPYNNVVAVESFKIKLK